MWGTGRECPWQVRGTTLVVSGILDADTMYHVSRPLICIQNERWWCGKARVRLFFDVPRMQQEHGDGGRMAEYEASNQRKESGSKREKANKLRVVTS